MSRTWASSPTWGGSSTLRPRPRRSTAASVARSPSARAVASQERLRRGDAMNGQHQRSAGVGGGAEPVSGQPPALRPRCRCGFSHRASRTGSGLIPRVIDLAAPTAASRTPEPRDGSGQQRRAEDPAQRLGGHADVLQAGGEDDEGDRRAHVAVRHAGGQQRAHQHRRHAAEDERAGHRELDMPEGQGAQRGGQRQRHRLREVGPHELVGADPRIDEQQRDDHQ